MTSFEIAMPPAETGLQKLKNIVGKIFSPQAEKTRVVELSRDRVEELLSIYKEDEKSLESLRQDIVRRFEKMNGEAIPGNLNWLQIQNDLFEVVFKVNTDERARQILSEELGYSGELLTKIMHCVGHGQRFEAKKSN